MSPWDLLRLLPPLRRIDRFRADPAGTQRRALRSLLLRAARTEFGERHGFAEMARSEVPELEFAASVPLATTESLREPVERMRRGERDVLWPGRVTSFVQSTGTTGTPKILPCTDETLRQWVTYGASVVFSHAWHRRDLGCLRGRTFSLAGAVREDPEHPGARLGEISALAADYWASRSPLRRFVPDRDLPPSVRAQPSLDAQVDAACDFAMDRDVRMVSVAPSWALLLFERLIERHRARHGRRVETVGEIWPGLRLLICGGVPLATYRDALLERIGLPDVALVETYGASESLVALQERPDAEGMLLDLGLGTHFEFVRETELHDAVPRRVSIAGVTLGERWVPVVSTPSGLWACPIGDVVRFTSLSPHELVIEGRSAELIDSWGEKVTGEQAQRALVAAGIVARAFHLVPRPAREGRRHAHRWLIELASAPADVEALARSLDERLSAISAPYAHCRAELGLGPPEVLALREGALGRALLRARPRATVQAKVPRTSDRADLADAVGPEDRWG